ncbi:transporter [Weissella oryzae SG25]|uniref:Transporter n=1 Tax=Weissella oryzae (strain DSM 25784 / JCM 18191 / LMG 30913 / SG25) TaxID=1329250 RepID=A0A069CZN8_WEIOS|nr:AI-2E family transporter [Weissella oryzae]GAK30571.1 transporter [Weissella oryzae SG25]
MDYIVRFLKRDDVQLYATLFFLIALIFIFHEMISMILLLIIFSYLAIQASDQITKKTGLPYPLAVIATYLLVLGLLILAIDYIFPVLYNQAILIPNAIAKGLREYPVLADYATDLAKKLDIVKEVSSNWQTWASQLLHTVGVLSNVTLMVLLSVFMSFIFALTRFRIDKFGRQFLTSNHPKLFKNIYFLTSKFIAHLGAVVEVQLKITIINTILTVIGLLFIGLPSPFVMGVIVFILGFVPVAGVLISIIPLSMMAFVTGGVWMFVEVLILIILIHSFESYFLHPRLMAGRTHLPIFVTFVTLIVMERLLGAWGLIVGVPIVSYFLDILGVQAMRVRVNQPNNN